jgi:hypothetical protein
MKFKNLEYFAIGLLILVVAGFWPTYFSKFFDGSANFNTYFHLHAITAALWIVMLFIQPLLIRLRQLKWHRLVGKASYILVPFLFISIVLLTHSRNNSLNERAAYLLWISFKDIIIFSFGFGVAIIGRKDVQLHARGMIVTGLTLISPTVVRIMVNLLEIDRPLGFYFGLAPLYILLVCLIYAERNQSRGRWIFPTTLALFLFAHCVQISKLFPPFWEVFSGWFISLPLT